MINVKNGSVLNSVSYPTSWKCLFGIMHVRKLLSILLNLLGLCVVALLVYKLTAHTDDKYRIVKTKFGEVRGIRKTSLLKKAAFYSFKGIPYAKSPTGKLRFKVSFFSTFQRMSRT